MKRLRNRQATRNRVLLFIVGAVLLAVGVARPPPDERHRHAHH